MIARVFEAVARIQGIFIKKRLVRDFDDEWACIIEIATDENIRCGMDPQTARREALLHMGSVEDAREVHRDTCGLPLLETIGHDFRYAVRQLRRTPKFTLAAVLILAIAIGANAALFSEINAIFFKTLPVNRPKQLRGFVASCSR